jgi:hypothetical protein
MDSAESMHAAIKRSKVESLSFDERLNPTITPILTTIRQLNDYTSSDTLYVLEESLEPVPQIPEHTLVFLNEIPGVLSFGSIHTLPRTAPRTWWGEPHDIGKRQYVTFRHVKSSVLQEINVPGHAYAFHACLLTCFVDKIAIFITTDLHETRSIDTTDSVTTSSNSSFNGETTLR